MNMKQNTTSIIVAVTILLACVVQARYTDDDLDRFAKRSWSDQRIADYQARLALYQGRPLLSHGQFDTNKIFEKRTSSDQRIAELQALIALSRGSGIVGHGRIDPYGIGRRKRDTGILRTLINKNRLLQNSDDSHL
ncbi:uncharacterized protein LOC134683549 [Mytilus trossulus]|uniref:uncharacterized protein LOC134683549 n=1 Tax=Mytilus trossulus TaxID=6551 RepID=UPI0030040629